MNPPQVYMCSPFWTLLPPPSPYHPSGWSQCTSPQHPASCIEPGLATRFIHDIIHVLTVNIFNLLLSYSKCSYFINDFILLYFLVFMLHFYFFIFFYLLLYSIVSVLPYINMNPPWVYTCSPSWTSLPPPSPYHPSGSCQCTSPKHPVSYIEPGLVICFIYDIIHVSMSFSQIIPLSPSPSESKRLFYTSVSLLLSRIQGYHYHLSKFHIYVLVYWIGVFLSGLLHSV